MVQLALQINWQKQLSRNLRVVAWRIKDLKPFLKETVKLIEKRTDDIFKQEWSNVEKSPKWKSLSKSTQKARDNRRWYYAKKPNKPWTLRWTWNLQDNRTSKVTNKQAKLSFNAPYAGYHQLWGSRKNRPPQRSFVDLDNKTNALIIKELQKVIQKEFWIFWRQL